LRYSIDRNWAKKVRSAIKW